MEGRRLFQRAGLCGANLLDSFLKYLDDLEKDRQDAAALTGKTYEPIIAPEFHWEAWAAGDDFDVCAN